MTKTSLLIFHPNLSVSMANKSMRAAADRLEGIESVDMTALYEDGIIDIDAEVDRLLSSDRLILQFPLMWYSTPHLLKIWQNLVLTRMFYSKPEEGEQLRDMPVMLGVTVGNVPEAYGPAGSNMFPLVDLLNPLRATAHRCGWRWGKPFELYCANRLPIEDLEVAAVTYAAAIEEWANGSGAA